MKDHYFEDVKVGDTVISSKRKLQGKDFVDFARISRDYTPLHINEEFAKRTSRFGKRIAHGLFVISAAVGLLSARTHFRKTVVAVTNLHIKFIAPVYVGDTILVKHVIVQKRDVKSRTLGAVKAKVTILNQEGKDVAEYSYEILLRKRPR